MRRLLLVAGLVALLLPVHAALPSAAAPAPLDPVCSEPGGQTDTGAHPRLVRAVVDGVPVAVVLPVGYERGRARYPVVYLLHGAQGDEDSWIEYGGLMATTQAHPARDRAIVVMPKMGVVTGLAVDWVDGHRRDATFVSRTLVDWADRALRTVPRRSHRAVAGYSGGALSAAHLAEVAPDRFGQVGILSGPTDLTDPTTQPATWAALRAEQACAGDPTGDGPMGDPVTHADAWAAVDPTRHVDRLRRTTVFVSSGDGRPCSVEEAALLVYPTAATEPQIRRSHESLAAALTASGVRFTDQRRPCGLHWWSTWTPALADFWGLASEQWRRS